MVMVVMVMVLGVLVVLLEMIIHFVEGKKKKARYFSYNV